MHKKNNSLRHPPHVMRCSIRQPNHMFGYVGWMALTLKLMRQIKCRIIACLSFKHFAVRFLFIYSSFLSYYDFDFSLCLFSYDVYLWYYLSVLFFFVCRSPVWCVEVLKLKSEEHYLVTYFMSIILRLRRLSAWLPVKLVIHVIVLVSKLVM